MSPNKGKLDLPPEYCRYRDDGCEFANSCLNCPFPECIYAQPGGKQGWLKRLRDKEVLRLFTTQGKGVKELALMFGVSQRTIQRILKNYSISPPRSPSPGRVCDLSLSRRGGGRFFRGATPLCDSLFSTLQEKKYKNGGEVSLRHPEC